jgi:hypothetical protein
LAAAAAGKPMANNPLAPLLRRMSEQFIDDGDLSTRLQSLFKVPFLCDQNVLSISRQAALSRPTSLFGKWVGAGGGQVMDTDRSGTLSCQEFITAMKKLASLLH